jgi:hypothetical protein
MHLRTTNLLKRLAFTVVANVVIAQLFVLGIGIHTHKVIGSHLTFSSLKSGYLLK